jgi:hypothetical protein
MKRIVSIITLLIVICISVTACGANAGNNNGNTQTPTDNTVYSQLTRALSSTDFDSLTVTVTTEKDGVELNSTYVYTNVDAGIKIDFTQEKIGQFESSGGSYTSPDSMIVTAIGSVTVSNGKIVASEGDASFVDLSSAGYPEFKFKESYFSDVQTTDGEFSASVLSPLAFMGMSSSCSGMKVHVYYNVFRVSTIYLEYRASDGATVKTAYVYR